MKEYYTLEDIQRISKKQSRRKNYRGWFEVFNAGNVPYNIEMFNKMSGPSNLSDIGSSDAAEPEGSAGSSTDASVGNAGGEGATTTAVAEALEDLTKISDTSNKTTGKRLSMKESANIKEKIRNLKDGEIMTISDPSGRPMFDKLKIKKNPKYDNIYTLWNVDEEGNIYNEVKFSSLNNAAYWAAQGELEGISLEEAVETSSRYTDPKLNSEQNLEESTMNESRKDAVDIYYDDLEITVVTKKGNPSGYYDTSFGNWLPDDDETEEIEIEYDYEADWDDVYDVLWDNVVDEPEMTDMSDEEIEKYITDNFDDLTEKYIDKLRAYFEDSAREEAEEKYADEYLYEGTSSNPYIFRELKEAAESDIKLKDFWEDVEQPVEEEDEDFEVDTKLPYEGMEDDDPVLSDNPYSWNDIDMEAAPEENWVEVASKNVFDSDGFLTDYVWYTDGNKHVFVFGDSDRYQPEDGDFDWEIDIVEGKEAEAYKEAQDWFNSYKGFEEEDPDFDEVVLEDEPVLEEFKAQDCLTESYMGDLSVDVQEAGGKERLIKSLERQVLALQSELDFLNTIAPREIGAGGNFDSMEEIKEAATQTERALRTAQAKLGILKEGK